MQDLMNSMITLQMHESSKFLNQLHKKYCARKSLYNGLNDMINNNFHCVKEGHGIVTWNYYKKVSQVVFFKYLS